MVSTLQLTWHDNMPHVPTLQSIHTLSVVTFATASATKSSTLRLMLLNLQWNDFTMQPRHHQVCSMLRPVGWVEFQKEILWLSHWGSERLPNHLCHGDKLDLKNHWSFSHPTNCDVCSLDLKYVYISPYINILPRKSKTMLSLWIHQLRGSSGVPKFIGKCPKWALYKISIRAPVSLWLYKIEVHQPT